MRSGLRHRAAGRSRLNHALWLFVLYLVLLYVALRLGATGIGDLRITD